MATETTANAVEAAHSEASTKQPATATRKVKKKRRELTAKEATLRAWQKTYENRQQRPDYNDK